MNDPRRGYSDWLADQARNIVCGLMVGILLGAFGFCFAFLYFAIAICAMRWLYKPYTFFCPHCGGCIVADMEFWTCGLCQHRNHNVNMWTRLRYSFLRICGRCGRRQVAYNCHFCHKMIPFEPDASMTHQAWQNQQPPAADDAATIRHAAGDWGDVDEHDRRENEQSLDHGFRLFSVYHAADGTKFWIITEADRSATTVLLPEDY